MHISYFKYITMFCIQLTNIRYWCSNSISCPNFISPNWFVFCSEWFKQYNSTIYNMPSPRIVTEDYYSISMYNIYMHNDVT